MDNGGTAVYTPFQVVGLTDSQTNEVVGHQYTAGTPEAYRYDADGNLLRDGRWDYTWDGENRLVGLETLRDLPASVPRQRLEFGYDSQSRRVRKTVYTQVTNAWVLAAESYYLYDGWNLVAESRRKPETLRVTERAYVWGNDLSGSMQGAGGIGGLLCATAQQPGATATVFAAYDGNGNVMALVDAGTLQEAARYEYGPFGEVLRETGPQAHANPFRFSSKYTDDETGLVYYGYRYYQPESGRWINRDPSGETSEADLYNACGNNAIDNIDLFGLWLTDVHKDLTITWATTDLRMPTSGSVMIGEKDDYVDTKWNPNFISEENWQYHFNRYLFGGDSRIVKSDEWFKEACRKCNSRSFAGSDDWKGAAEAMGYSLHPIQDYVAHGDFNRKSEMPDPSYADRLHLWHNYDAPGHHQQDVDNKDMDALVRPSWETTTGNGRPELWAMEKGGPLHNGGFTYWCKFAYGHGRKRLQMTQNLTETRLSAFMNFVETHSKPCGECRKNFLPSP